MSEQEIRNLKKEMQDLTKSVNQALEVAKASAATAYTASKNNNEAVAEIKKTIDEIKITLEPMAQIYSKTGIIWTVVKYLFTFIVILAGLLLTLKELFKK